MEASYIITIDLLFQTINYMRDKYFSQSFLAGHNPCKIISETIFVLQAFF